MKKMFLAVLTSLALCSYGFAQDDEEEYYEEEEAPAKVEKKAAAEEEYEEEEEAEEEEAPAKKKEKKSSRKPGEAILGFGIDLGAAIIGGVEGSGTNARFNVVYKLNPNMELSLILGMLHHGATTEKQPAGDVEWEDSYTALSVGAGFDYYLGTPVLPTSVGAQVIYDSFGKDHSGLEFNIVFGAHAEIVKNFVVSANIGLGILYDMDKNDGNDTSRLDFGFVPGIKATWYAF